MSHNWGLADIPNIWNVLLFHRDNTNRQKSCAKNVLLKFGSSPSCIKVQNVEYISHCCSRVIWQTRSSPVTHDQHAPVLSLALQGDVTSLSVSQQTSLSSYLPHQSTDLIQSDLQRQKAFEPLRDDLFGGVIKEASVCNKMVNKGFCRKECLYIWETSGDKQENMKNIW